jgi:hypothetical protein
MTRLSIILGSIGLLVAATTAQAASSQAIGKPQGPAKSQLHGKHAKQLGARSAGGHPGSARIHCPAGYANNDMGGCTWGGRPTEFGLYDPW